MTKALLGYDLPLTCPLLDWIAGIGEDAEVVLERVGAGAEDEIIRHVRNGDLRLRNGRSTVVRRWRVCDYRIRGPG